MLLQPKRTSYRKQSKGKLKGIVGIGMSRSHGSVGLRCVELGRISARQLEAARRTIRHHLEREGQVQMKVFPDVPVTSKPTEVRMGKGKGSVEQQGAKVRPGMILFEVDGVSRVKAQLALTSAGKKLAIKTNRKYRSNIKVI